jgi:hypothetical protein
MSRNLDPTLAASLSAGVIQPVLFVQITFNSGTEYVWSGIGDFDFNGHTFSGVGNLGSIGPIAEGSSVKADGTSVTLSGIGLSQVPQPTLGITPPPAPFPGLHAWAYPAAAGPSQLTFGHGDTGLFAICTGAASSSPASKGSGASGAASYSVSRGLGQTDNGVVFGAFKVDGGLPADAVISGIYPMVNVGYSRDLSACFVEYGTGMHTDSRTAASNISFPGSPFGASFFGQLTGASIGTDVGLLATINIRGQVSTSLFGNNVTDSLGIANPAMAVYYTSASGVIPPATLVQEALRDVRMGAPAKIWFGLMANGALIGTPYLVFSGTVDKPNVQIDEKTASITLALENRLVNLQRANQRRYTAADQKLAYPTDMAFNWVESLNDIALRWGS